MSKTSFPRLAPQKWLATLPTGDTTPNRLTALPQFVIPTGGVYCFVPSITALKTLL
jgi:hypothetical protein